MIDAKGIAALDLRIRFGSILLLFLAGVAVSLFALVLCIAYDASPSARSLVAIAVADLTWIWSYQLMAEDLVLFAIAKLLMWAGIELSSLPGTDFETGNQSWLPAVFLVIVIIAPQPRNSWFGGFCSIGCGKK
jgi:membrane-anchored glycerophosphoryl diester phosphodiesterase (GDPDase)